MLRPGLPSALRRSAFIRIAAACLMFAAAAPVRGGLPAGDDYWVTTSATPGNWSDATNWTPGVPTTNNNAIIQAGIGATANLGAGAVAKTLFVNGDATLQSGTLALDASQGNLWMNEGAATTLTLDASDALGNVLVTTPTATIGASDTNNGVWGTDYLTNVLNLTTAGAATASLTVAGDLNIGNDGSGNAVQTNPAGSSAAAAAISAGSIKLSIASTAGAVYYNWIGTYGDNDTLTATNLQVGYAGDQGGAENYGGTWTVTNTLIGDQATASSNYVLVADGGTTTNNGQMVVGVGGSFNTLYVGYLGSAGTLDMSASASDLEIGAQAGAETNTVVLEAGTLTVDKRIVVGNAGGTNSLVASDSSAITSGGADIGRSSNLNYVGLQNTTWTVNGTVRLGDDGSTNSFDILSGSVVTLTQPNKDFTIGYGSSTASNDNQLLVSGAGSRLVVTQANTALWISGVNGVGGGTGNRAVVTNGGVLEVDNVIVAPGGTLAGNASVIGTVSVASGGTLAPGDGTAGSIGTLTVNGAVDFAPSVGGLGLLEIDIDGSSSDLLVVTGNLDVTGTTIDLNFLGPVFRFEHVIAEYGTLSGTFGSVVNLPSGWFVDYHFGGLNRIAIVPEPSALVLAGLGIAGAAGWRLRRRRAAGGR